MSLVGIWRRLLGNLAWRACGAELPVMQQVDAEGMGCVNIPKKPCTNPYMSADVSKTCLKAPDSELSHLQHSHVVHITTKCTNMQCVCTLL